MSGLRVFSAQASLLLGLTSLTAGCINEDALNPMSDRQPKVQAYSPSPFYRDGVAMRQPPAGTVAREQITNNIGLSSGLASAPGPNGEPVYVTSFPAPLKVDRAFLNLGRKRYDVTCATCHGPVGDGESIVAHQMALRPPPSLIAYADRPVGYIFEVATHGFGLMASYAAELPVMERWAVVAYIRALQTSQSYEVAKLSPDELRQVEAESTTKAPQETP